MNKTSEKTSSQKKNILIIGTGGTIAGTGSGRKTASYNSAQLEVTDLVSEIPDLESIANITSKNMFNIDSCDMTIDKLITLAKYINEEAKKDTVDGFVITHGTDTLEETAYFLNLVLKTNKPVVLTGSVRPSTAISADGPLNLYESVALAKSDEAYGKGVLIVFSDAIFGARDVTKINTFKASAFGQKDLGSLGYMRDDEVFFLNLPSKLHTVNTEFDIDNIESLPKVEILTFYASADVDLLKYASERSQGIVLAGAGCGGSSSLWDSTISEIIKANIPVVRSSRIGNGLVTYEKSEISTKGVYSVNLTPAKSRILLSLALTRTNNLYQIQEMFEKY